MHATHRALSTKQGPWRSSHVTSSARDNPEKAARPELTSDENGFPSGGTADISGAGCFCCGVLSRAL